MEGTETGWGRPAEPTPRWRALLDRARQGDRVREQAETAEHRGPSVPPGPPEDRPSPPPAGSLFERLPQRRSQHSYRDQPWLPEAGQRDGVGLGHPAEMGNIPAPRPPADPAYGGGPAQVNESRWALLESGYHPGPGRRPEPEYRPEPGHVGAAEVPGQSRWGALEPAASVEWRQPRPDAEVERALGVLRRDLGSPRVLAFANPKGGVHKTTATVLAAATVGGVRGRGVLAWDDNELRGTLGLRAGSARHARTIRHLITDLALVEAQHGEGLVQQLDDYLRHASDGSYDVLAGEENPRFASRLDQHTVRRVLELLRRTHDVICVDTGNNVESVNWRTVMQAADQLVITTVPREDAAFTADWMIDLLHDVGMGELAANAVTLLSCPSPERSPLLDDLYRHFATRTRAVAVVPYDPALETGSSIEYGQLRHETRQAWLKAAAMMLEPFVR